MVDGRYGRPLELDRTAAGRRDGAAAGEIQHRRHAAYRVLRTPFARGGASFCASLGLLHAEGMLSLPYEAVLLAAAATAWLMISPIRMFALKFHGFGWRGNRLRYLFLGACVVLILTLGAYAIPAIFVLYVVVSLVRWLLQGLRAAEA